jgi:peroxiredoxin
MNKLYLIIGLLICIDSLGQNPFVLKFKVNENLVLPKLYINATEGNLNKRDSIEIRDNQGVFNGSANLMATIRISNRKNFADRTFYAAPGDALTIEIAEISETGLSDVMVFGSVLNEDYNGFIKAITPINKKIMEIAMERNKQPRESDQYKACELRIADLYNSKVVEAEEFIRANPDSKASLHVFAENIISSENADEVFAVLTDNAKYNKAMVSGIEKSLVREGLTKIGIEAPEFSSKTADGKVVSLSSYRGKYVLVDFWASWCKPCRAENPNVLKAYNEFKDKNFDILAVSIDDDREKWLKAVEEDHLPWTQVSELQGWNTDAIKKYGVIGIPSNFLIDPDGKIVAKNLRGFRLSDTLSKNLKN